jgi:hypothetical protein
MQILGRENTLDISITCGAKRREEAENILTPEPAAIE